MSSSSAYSSPSTSSVGLHAHSSIKLTNSGPQQPHPRTTHPIPHHPSSNEPAVRRRVGLPYSSNQQHPTRRTSLAPKTITPSRSLITVLPPDSLSCHPPQLRPNAASSAYGPSARFRKGILVPLYPTLAAQLAAISREYGLPSTGGMVLYLVEGSSHTGELANQLVDGPKISEEAWQILWSGVFEDEQEEAFQHELQTKELYDDQDLDPQPHILKEQPSYLPYDQATEEEEVLNGGLEELINSGLNFPNPPLNARPTQPVHVSPSSQEDLASNSTTLSTQPSPISSYSSSRSSDLLKLNSTHNLREGSALAQQTHARSLSSVSNQFSSIRPVRLQSADFPSRPSTALSTQLPRHRSLRRTGLSSLSNHRPALSDRGSLHSFSARPRRIGAGTIVGKIEFDIDRSRSSSRWYDLWLNPPSLNRNNNLHNSYISSDDHARPLLLPNLITQRKKSRDLQKRLPNSSNITESSRITKSNGSTPSQNKSHSFLAFDDNLHHLDSQSGFESPNPGHIFYSNQDSCSKEELYPRDSTASELNHFDKLLDNTTEGISEKRQFGARIVNEQHRQAVAMIAAQAKHQALVDQIDAQLCSPIDLNFARTHSYGLSLGVDSHLKLADINHDDIGCTFLISPATDPTSTHSLALAAHHLSFNENLVASDLDSSKRNSSMAIKNNLDDLEQALASLSPRALRFDPTPSPLSIPSPPTKKTTTDIIEEPRTSSLGWSKRTTDRSSGHQSQLSSDSFEEKGAGRGFKMLENFVLNNNHHHDDQTTKRSSHSDVPVGLTEGYTREDLREYKAPLSPVVAKRSFSPVLKSIMQRPITPTTKRSGEGFVTKAASIMSGKFRNSGSR